MPPITTIAYELTAAASEDLERKRMELGTPQLRKLKICNLEKSYNFRTVGSDFKLVTSVLANSNDYITISIQKGFFNK